MIINFNTTISKTTKDEWLTPPWITENLGPFDLDPCSPIVRPWPTAHKHLTINDDGLANKWPEDNLIWCNPPYGRETFKWMNKLAEHPGGGIALIFARTETKGFHEEVWNKATSILFLKGRLRFHHVSGQQGGTANAPSCLIAYGEEAHKRLLKIAIKGKLVSLKQARNHPHT